MQTCAIPSLSHGHMRVCPLLMLCFCLHSLSSPPALAGPNEGIQDGAVPIDQLRRAQDVELKAAREKLRVESSQSGADTDQLMRHYNQETDLIKATYNELDTRNQRMQEVGERTGAVQTGSPTRDVRADADSAGDAATNARMEEELQQRGHDLDTSEPHKITDRTDDHVHWRDESPEAIESRGGSPEEFRAAKDADFDAYKSSGGQQATGNTSEFPDEAGHGKDLSSKSRHAAVDGDAKTVGKATSKAEKAANRTVYDPNATTEYQAQSRNPQTGELVYDGEGQPVMETKSKPGGFVQQEGEFIGSLESHPDPATRALAPEADTLVRQARDLQQYQDPVQAGITEPADSPAVENQKMTEWTEQQDRIMRAADERMTQQGEVRDMVREDVESSYGKAGPSPEPIVDPDNPLGRDLNAEAAESIAAETERVQTSREKASQYLEGQRAKPIAEEHYSGGWQDAGGDIEGAIPEEDLQARVEEARKRVTSQQGAASDGPARTGPVPDGPETVPGVAEDLGRAKAVGLDAPEGASSFAPEEPGALQRAGAVAAEARATALAPVEAVQAADAALAERAGVVMNLPEGAGLRAGANRAAAGGLAVVGGAIMANELGKSAGEYAEGYDRAMDPETTDAEAEQALEQMDQAASTWIVMGSLGAAAEAAPLAVGAPAVGAGTFILGRTALENSENQSIRDFEAWKAEQMDKNVYVPLGEDIDRIKSAFGYPTRADEQWHRDQDRRIGYIQALRRGDIVPKEGVTQEQLRDALVRAAAGEAEPGELQGLVERNPDQPRPDHAADILVGMDDEIPDTPLDPDILFEPDREGFDEAMNDLFNPSAAARSDETLSSLREAEGSASAADGSSIDWADIDDVDYAGTSTAAGESDYDLMRTIHDERMASDDLATSLSEAATVINDGGTALTGTRTVSPETGTIDNFMDNLNQGVESAMQEWGTRVSERAADAVRRGGHGEATPAETAPAVGAVADTTQAPASSRSGSSSSQTPTRWTETWKASPPKSGSSGSGGGTVSGASINVDEHGNVTTGAQVPVDSSAGTGAARGPSYTINGKPVSAEEWIKHTGDPFGSATGQKKY